jgi:hypothetical protein
MRGDVVNDMVACIVVEVRARSSVSIAVHDIHLNVYVVHCSTRVYCRGQISLCTAEDGLRGVHLRCVRAAQRIANAVRWAPVQ